MRNFRPLPTKCWIAFLIFKGFHYDRTSSSHDQYKKPNYRTIPVWGSEKEIPAFHLRTSCKTIGCTIEEVYEWADKNC